MSFEIVFTRPIWAVLPSQEESDHLKTGTEEQFNI